MITRSVLSFGRLCRVRFSTTTPNEQSGDVQQYKFVKSDAVLTRLKEAKGNAINIYGALSLAFFVPFGGVAALPLLAGVWRYLQILSMERAFSQLA